MEERFEKNPDMLTVLGLDKGKYAWARSKLTEASLQWVLRSKALRRLSREALSCFDSRTHCSEASVSFDRAHAYLPLSSPRTVSWSGFFVSRSSMKTSNSAPRRSVTSLAGGAVARARLKDGATHAATSEPATVTNCRRSITRASSVWPRIRRPPAVAGRGAGSPVGGQPTGWPHGLKPPAYPSVLRCVSRSGP